MATASSHTPAGGTVVIMENGAIFSRQLIVRRMATATPRHPVSVRVALAKSEAGYCMNESIHLC